MVNKEVPELPEDLPLFPPLNIRPVRGEYVGLDRYPFDEEEIGEVIKACGKYNCRKGSGAEKHWQYCIKVEGEPQIKLGRILLETRADNALEQFKQHQKEQANA